MTLATHYTVVVATTLHRRGPTVKRSELPVPPKKWIDIPKGFTARDLGLDKHEGNRRGREMMRRALVCLEERGLITRTSDVVTVVDMERLGRWINAAREAGL